MSHDAFQLLRSCVSATPDNLVLLLLLLHAYSSKCLFVLRSFVTQAGVAVEVGLQDDQGMEQDCCLSPATLLLVHFATSARLGFVAAEGT